MNEILTIPNIMLYVIIINVIGFCAMWIDKRKAQHRKLENTGKNAIHNNIIRWRDRYNTRNVCIQTQNQKTKIHNRISSDTNIRNSTYNIFLYKIENVFDNRS